MNRRFLLLAAFAILSPWSAAFAQITVEPTFKPGVKMAATLEGAPLEGATAQYAWTYDEGVSVEEVDGGRRLLLWAAPNDVPYKLHCGITYTLEFPTTEGPKKVTLPPYHFDAQFVVEGAGPPPVVPPLAVLAGKDAQKLGTLYAALAPQVQAITSAASFKAVHAKLLADQGLTGNGAAAAIDKRLESALEPYSAVKLKSVLEEFVAELGSLPPPPGPDSPATAATYIYEKDNTAIPVGVSTGLNRLNREKNIRATLFEEDTVDGDGDVPDQYKVPLEAATKAGLPSLVVTNGSAVVNVVKNPTTEEQVWGAVQ
jgi:hypothetical protein